MIRRPYGACLVAFFTIGFLLRAILAIAWPTIHRPDETFQNLEPAYRLLTGWGVVSWEWRAGIRSYVFPDFLFTVMRTARLLDLPLLPSVSIVLSAIAASAIPVAMHLGWRRYALPGAVICGALAATWPDLVYFGPKPLVEVQSGTLLFLAAALASLDRKRPLAIGLLLGLAFDLRFQLAPALAVVAIAAAWRDVRHGWLPLLAAAAIPVALLGLVDWLTWGSPFQSIWKNIQANFVDNRSEIYGVEPFNWYALQIAIRYGFVTVPLVLCFGLGARVAPLLAITSIVVVAFHSLIAHKEISFIYAALPCALAVAGLGAARLLTLLPKSTSARGLAAAGLTCVAATALAGQTAKSFREAGASAQIRPLWAIAGSRPDLCGLGLYGSVRFPWVYTPGYVGLERDVPIYLLQSPEALIVAEPGFNYLIVDAGSVASLPEGDQVACEGKFCLLHRDNACMPVAGLDINAVMSRLGQ